MYHNRNSTERNFQLGNFFFLTRGSCPQLASYNLFSLKVGTLTESTRGERPGVEIAETHFYSLLYRENAWKRAMLQENVIRNRQKNRRSSETRGKMATFGYRTSSIRCLIEIRKWPLARTRISRRTSLYMFSLFLGSHPTRDF